MLSVILSTVNPPWLLLPFWGSITGFSSGGINALFLSSWRLDRAAACLVWRLKNKENILVKKVFFYILLLKSKKANLIYQFRAEIFFKIQNTQLYILKSTVVDITLISSSFFFLFWLFLRKYSPLSRSLSIYKSQTGNSFKWIQMSKYIFLEVTYMLPCYNSCCSIFPTDRHLPKYAHWL